MVILETTCLGCRGRGRCAHGNVCSSGEWPSKDSQLNPCQGVFGGQVVSDGANFGSHLGFSGGLGRSSWLLAPLGRVDSVGRALSERSKLTVAQIEFSASASWG